MSKEHRFDNEYTIVNLEKGKEKSLSLDRRPLININTYINVRSLSEWEKDKDPWKLATTVRNLSWWYMSMNIKAGNSV